MPRNDFIQAQVAMLGFGNPDTQWGGTTAVTRDIMDCLASKGETPLYIYGTGELSGALVRKTQHGYAIAAKRFFLNTAESFFVGQDNTIIEAVFEICRKHGIRILHIQDYCGWPSGLIARLEAGGIKVIVKIGNAWSLCPRLTLFSAQGVNCAANYQLAGCASCVSTFRTANTQSMVKRVKSVLHALGLINHAQSLYAKLFSQKVQLSRKNTEAFFISRRQSYLNDLEKASVVHFSSSMSLDIYTRHGYRADNTRVLNPSVNINGQLRGVAPVSSAFRRFGYLGGLSRLKGVDVLIQAFDGLVHNGQAAELLIWGEGDRSLIASLPANIRYMGGYNRSMLANIMAQVDCGVLPSSCPDVHPIVALEYAAAKRPVIMSSSCGTATSPTNNFPELVFDSGSHLDLRNKVHHLQSNWTAIRDRSGMIPKPKSMETVVEEYLALYAELTG